jgi:hypothetical protein
LEYAVHKYILIRKLLRYEDGQKKGIQRKKVRRTRHRESKVTRKET